MKVVLIVNDNNIKEVIQETDIYRFTRLCIKDLDSDTLDSILRDFIDEEHSLALKYGLNLDKSQMLCDYKALVAKVEDVEQIHGEYFAHEYDVYTKGLATKTVYLDDCKNKYENVFISCLDSKLSVMDGYWEDVYHNGCGDTFSPSSRFTI